MWLARWGFRLGWGGWLSPVPLPMQEVEEVDTAEEEEPGDPQDPGQVSPHDGSRSWGGEPCAQRGRPEGGSAWEPSLPSLASPH